MARRKKHTSTPEEASEPTGRKVPDRLNSPFAEALRGVSPAPPPRPDARGTGGRAAETRPRGGAGGRAASGDAGSSSGDPAGSPAPRPTAPLASYEYADRAAFHQAFSGVRPLGPAKDAGRKGPPRLPEARAAKPPEWVDHREDEARKRLSRLVAGEVQFEVRRDEEGAVVGQRRGGHPSHLRTLVEGVAPQGNLDLHGLTGDAAEREVSRFVRERHRRGDRVVLLVHGKGRHSAGEIGVLEDHTVRALVQGGAAPLVVAFRTAPERLGGRGALVVRLREG